MLKNPLLWLLFGAGVYAFLVSTAGRGHYARRDRVVSDLQQAEFASALFHEDHRRWPKNWDELNEGRYFHQLPLDPWSDEPYVWVQEGNRPPIFISWGPDLRPGGEFESDDIVSRDGFDRFMRRRRGAQD